MYNRILVVDDEPDLEVLIPQRFRKRIRAAKLSFLFASNGEEALAKLPAAPCLDAVRTASTGHLWTAALSKPSIPNRSYTAKSG